MRHTQEVSGATPPPVFHFVSGHQPRPLENLYRVAPIATVADMKDKTYDAASFVAIAHIRICIKYEWKPSDRIRTYCTSLSKAALPHHGSTWTSTLLGLAPSHWALRYPACLTHSKKSGGKERTRTFYMRHFWRLATKPATIIPPVLKWRPLMLYASSSLLIQVSGAKVRSLRSAKVNRMKIFNQKSLYLCS